MATKNYWLVKSEPDDYSIDDLRVDIRTAWTGVRNYEARNLMRDGMKPGDEILYYHSSTKPSGVVGTARVVSDPHVDPTQFEVAGPYYDPKASEEEPRWWFVDLEFLAKLPRTITLREIKAHADLAQMALVKKPRLSVQPVTATEYRTVLRMAGDPPIP